MADSVLRDKAKEFAKTIGVENISKVITAEEYWNTFYYMQEAVKLAFDNNGITIPYGQLDVHITKE